LERGERELSDLKFLDLPIKRGKTDAQKVGRFFTVLINLL